MDLKRALRRTKCLFFGGLALLFLALMPEPEAVKLVLAVLGVALTVGGVSAAGGRCAVPAAGRP